MTEWLPDRTLVIAEIGNNHEGDADVARELVRRVADAGADAVKFQTYSVGHFVRPQDERRYEQLTRFQLSREEVESIAGLAHELGLMFVSTPLDLDSARFLEPLVDAYKIASGDNDFVPLIDLVCATGKPLILSTGLLDLEGVGELRDRLTARGAAERSVLLHTVTAYPSPPDQVNLAAIPLLARELGVPVGYSDHTLDNEACVLAVAMGAPVIEKHVTLDHDFSDFRDHKLSATPEQLAELVRRVRAARVLAGSAEKRMQADEGDLLAAVRRSIVAARDLPEGTSIAAGDLTWMRPRDGLEPGREDELIGRTLRRALAKGETVLVEDTE